jgi:hypothetical protein
METVRYEMIVEATTPIAHHSEVFGNSAIAMRRKIRQSDGTLADVPIVTGDTLRHGLREASSYALLDSAGLLDDAQLSEAALRLLFAGGMLTGRGDASSVKLDQYRQMVDVMPTLALFGGCANNRAIPGRLIVDDAVLICVESSAFVPAWVSEWLEESGVSIDSCRAYLEEVQRVRMDPVLDPGKRKLLSAGAAEAIQSRLLASESAHDDGDASGLEKAKSTMLPRRFERVAQGSLFLWSIEATCYSELDLDTFNTTVACYLANARVGGKRGTGHGSIRCVTARKVALTRPAERAEPEVTSLTRAVGAAFRAHVLERRDRLREFLSAVDA